MMESFRPNLHPVAFMKANASQRADHQRQALGPTTAGFWSLISKSSNRVADRGILDGKQGGQAPP